MPTSTQTWTNQQRLTINQKLRAKRTLAQQRSKGNFYYFVKHVFSKSNSFNGNFVSGRYIKGVALHLQNNPYTMDVTGRDHFKSTRLYAEIMWAIFCDEGKGWEAHYFSFSQSLAAYHLTKLKEMIKGNPYFSEVIDNKPTSESIISYQWRKTDRKMTVTPQGLTSFKRGIHAERIYVDDPFKSEEEDTKKLDPVQIRKVNGIVISELMPMVKKGGVCRIVGTPQTPTDFFFNEGMQERFKTWITPTIQDEPNGIALWPEWHSFDELIKIRNSMPISKFNKEYMAMPASSANSYIERVKLMPLCTLDNWTYGWHTRELDGKMVVAGYDIGKKVHPSHLSVFIETARPDPETDETVYSYEEIYQKWFDHWEYTDQVKFLNDTIDYFNISVLRYDNTRGEFMFAEEQNILHKNMEPIVSTSKQGNAMGANFGSIVNEGRIKFVNDARQINQILAVDTDLDAAESPEGHGDSFWSCAMATYRKQIAPLRIRTL